MPGFTKDALRTPFGENVYLRSTRDVKTESYTVAASTVPSITIDGVAQKVLDKGVVMARITSGTDSGKIGPYQGGATNERVQIAVDATGGTFTITYAGATTAAIAFNASAATVRAALVALAVFGADDIIVTGGPGSAGAATPYVLEFTGDLSGENVGAVTTSAVSLTGGAGTAAVTVLTQGAAGDTGAATDGRSDPNNIVGFNNTFLPWQLLERDVEVAVVYEASVVQAWCLQANAAGSAYVTITNATVDAMRPGRSSGVAILFK